MAGKGNPTGRRAAVIGAGAAGLCAAKHLAAAGLEVCVFEIGTKIGGLWVYENDNGLSPAYRSLHINSETKVTAYKDFQFPDDCPIYPSHWQMADYLRAYARRFDLEGLIRFNTRVKAIRLTDDGPYEVELEGGKTETFDAVIVGSGHQGVPAHPPFRDGFTGDYIHAHDYREPDSYKGKRVLVVGVGNSACDIAADICTVTERTVIAARSAVLIMPRMLCGVPTARVLAKMEKHWMPWGLRRRIRETIAWLAHGKMEQWGFRTPKTRTHPTSHPSLMAHFVWNRITAKPGIRAVEGQAVTFEDGSVEEFDAMIAATGYDVDLPFLTDDQSPVQGRWLALYHRVLRPGHPGLYFVGFFNVSGGGNIRMMDDQAEWIAALESGELDRPSETEMQAGIARERYRIRRNYPDSPRYGLELDPREYRADLAKVTASRKATT